MSIDWFALAHVPVDELRAQFGVVPKSPDALASGSVGPWHPGGILEFQLEHGQQRASALGVAYESFGAT